MLIIYKFKVSGKMIKKNAEFHIIKAFVMLMRYVVLFSLLGPVVGPVAQISFSGLSTGYFTIPLGAIMKDTLGKGPAVFLYLFPRLFLLLFFED